MSPEKNHKQLRSLIFDQLTAPVAIIDSDGKVEECNPIWEESFPVGIGDSLAAFDPALPVLAVLAKAVREGRAEALVPDPSGPAGRIMQLVVKPLDKDHFVAMTGAPENASLDRLKSMFDSLHDAVYIHDLSGRFLGGNQTAFELLGLNREEIRDLSFTDLLPEAEVPKALSVIQELLANGVLRRSTEFNLRRKDGTTVSIETTGTLIHERGAPVAVIGIARDITGRNRMIDSLTQLGQTVRDEQERLRNIIDNMSEALFVVDEHGIIREANLMCERMLGVPRADLVGRDYEQFHAPAVAEELRGLVEPLRDGREHFVALERKVGRRWIAFRFAALRDSAGSYRGFTLNLGDVTPLVEARQRAEEANQAKSRFLAHMSHEIRTPMNGILGFAELLAGAGLSPEQARYVEGIESSGNHLLHLINQVLDLARIESGRSRLEKRDFSPRTLARQAIEMVRHAADKKGLELTSEIQPDIPGRLHGDDRKLLQVLVNLLGNAVKFTVRGRVKLTLAFDGSFLNARVSDTGPGIAASDQERIFSAFEQAEGSPQKQREGTGLGLAISRKLAEAMGGGIKVESRPGAGATFIFTARLEPATGKEEEPVDAPAPREVLLVTTDATLREELRRLADASGMSAVLAPPAETELRVKLHEPVAVIFGNDSASSRAARKLRPSSTVTLIAVLEPGASRPEWADRELRLPATAATLAEAVGPAAPPDPSGATPGPLVLVAEDHPLNLEMIMELLRRNGFRAEGAEDGFKCLARARELRPDLVLMDLAMPGMDGFETLRNFRADPATAQAPVIAITAYAMPEDRERVLRAGFNGYVAKPFTPAELMSAIEHELGRPGGAS